MTDVILALGSNLGKREKNLSQACCFIEELNIASSITLSDLFETPALLLDGSPYEWDLPFMNIAMKGSTTLELEEFFTAIQNIEKLMGRSHTTPKWSPRIIDIDIIFFGKIVIENEKYTIPHKELLKRDFVLIPIMQIAPNYQYPGQGIFHKKSIIEIVKSLNFKSSIINKGHLNDTSQDLGLVKI